MITRDRFLGVREASQRGGELRQLLRIIEQYEDVVADLLPRVILPGGVDLVEGVDLSRELARIEHDILSQYLEAVRGNTSKASRLLHMHRSTLLARMDKLGLNIHRRHSTITEAAV